MGIIENLLNTELINLKNKSRNTDVFFKTSSKKLLELGFVEESFEKAIIEREKKYPTGLDLETVSIAIPHTDVEHIKEPFLYFNKIVDDENIEFIQMGTDDVIVNPKYVMVLGIKNPKEQVDLLSTIIELFNDEKFVSGLSQAENNKEVYRLFVEEN